MTDTPIGTNSPNYMLQPEDEGATIFCRVTATNAVGSAPAFSNTVGPVAAAPPVIYAGPGDVVTGAAGWWGLRAYSAATIGDACVRLVRASDSAQQDFVTLADGSLDVASITTWLSATTGKVVTLYDQSGNGNNATQTTDANRPAFILNAKGTLPAIAGDGTATRLVIDLPGVTLDQPYSVSATLIRTGDFSGTSVYFGSGEGAVHSYFAGASTLTMYAGTGGVNATATDNAWHVIQETFDDTSSRIFLDGALAVTGAAGTTHFSGGASIFSTGTAAGFFLGRLGEVGIWPDPGFDATQDAAMDDNQSTYWGI